ncbi:MAG: hypothetical protein PW734_11300 [Verrucomicrobium sp.]|nr:hypothetical protein [Verrucomicrobium sp.]
MSLFHHSPPPEPERHLPFFKLWDAFVPGECPVCHLVATHRAQMIATLFEENVNDVGTRMHLHRSLGFSPGVAEQIGGSQDALGISIIYRSLCQDVVERLAQAHPHLKPEEPCLVLEAERRDEERVCDEFALHYVATDFQERHAQSFGLCAGHLAQVLHRMAEGEAKERLREVEREKFAALAQQLDLYLDKSRYDNRQEMGAEKTAWDAAQRKLRRPEPR